MNSFKSKKKSTKIILSIVFWFLILVVILGIVYLTFFMSVHSPCAYTKSHEIEIIAHRGANSYAPENSLGGIKEARLHKYYATEFDLNVSGDGTWYVMHDDTLDRTTDGTGEIEKTSDVELSKMRIDFANGLDKYPDERIPTAEEMLDVCYLDNIKPIIEIKKTDNKNRDYKALANIIRYHASPDAVIISFDQDVLAEMATYLPELEFWLVTNNITNEQIDFCVEHNIDGIDFNCQNPLYVTKIAKCKEKGLVLGAWTVDNMNTAKYLNSIGVQYMTSNKISPIMVEEKETDKSLS